MTDRKSRRSYDNRLREERAGRTRARILEGVVEACIDGSLDDLSVAIVAERSGVSPATIYRHFPNREALLKAVERTLAEKFGRPSLPRTAEDLGVFAHGLAAFFDDNVELMKLSRSTSQKLDQDTRAVRDAMIAELLAEELADLPAEDAQAITGVFRSLISLDLFLTQRERYGASVDSAGRAARWAVETLLRQLRQERQARAADGPSTAADHTPGEPP